MMKRKGFLFCLVLAALLLFAGLAAAEAVGPIVAEMELSPTKLTGPGKVNVTITISNSGDQDLTEPVKLYDPAAQPVTDFGTNGEALLKAGESRTWTGEYDVNQRTLDNGSVVYFVKYTLVGENGKAEEKSQPIRAKIALQTAETDIEIKRTISPTIAREGQQIIVRYEIMNTGTVNLLDITIEEKKDILKDISTKKQTIPVLKPGQTAEIKYPVTMEKKDLTSGAKITYKSETQSKAKTYTVEAATIKYGEPGLEAKLTSDVKGVTVNGTVTLKLTLKNVGSVDYSDIRVADASLGEVFTNQELKAGKTLELTKEVTVPETAEYCFTVEATDATGNETSVSTDPLTITVVSPEDALTLTVTATPDRTEVYEKPGRVRFTIKITNDSNVTAKNVEVSHGDVDLYTFAEIGPGETRTLSRDFALSTAGKYRFTVTAQDPLDSPVMAESNETQIAFSLPTAAPATPTPVPVPTAEPTFVPATIPPIASPDISPMPKLIQKIAGVVAGLAGLMLLACIVLLLVAAVKRQGRKKAAAAAVDQLEYSVRHDYTAPAEDVPPEQSKKKKKAKQPKAAKKPVQADPYADLADDPGAGYELPHMKYTRDAKPEDDAYAPAEEPSALDPYAPYDDPAAAPEAPAPADEPAGDVAFRRPADDRPADVSAADLMFKRPVEDRPAGAPAESAASGSDFLFKRPDYNDTIFRRPQEADDAPARRSRRSRSEGGDE